MMASHTFVRHIMQHKQSHEVKLASIGAALFSSPAAASCLPFRNYIYRATREDFTMPEGPELHLASKFVNESCRGRIFSGEIVKNPVHKSSDIEFGAPAYTISAASRGKEMQLILTKLDSHDSKHVNGHGEGDTRRKHYQKKNDGPAQVEKDSKKVIIPETLKILFRFGMSGNFQFTTPGDIHKHSHLKFYTKDHKPLMVLSYVDVRRFGRWEVDADWSKNRGPDPMFEYQAFRSNVVKNMQKPAFGQPICEVLLNQKFFNGIGNYLRAEILFRLSIPPFEKARNVLEGLSAEPPDVKPMKGGKRKGEEPDILHLCHTVPLEVIAIGAGGYTADGKASDYSDFMKWLQCYSKDGMTNMVDHNDRTVWFSGPPGPMVPKDGKSRSLRSPKKRKEAAGTDDVKTPKKSKKTEESDHDISKKNGKRTSKRTAKMSSETKAASNVPTSSQKREDTITKARGDTSTKARGDTSTKAREDTSTKARGDTSTKARGDTSTKARGGTSAKARGYTSTKARGDTSTKARGDTSTKARGDTSTKARGDKVNKKGRKNGNGKKKMEVSKGAHSREQFKNAASVNSSKKGKRNPRV